MTPALFTVVMLGIPLAFFLRLRPKSASRSGIAPSDGRYQITPSMFCARHFAHNLGLARVLAAVQGDSKDAESIRFAVDHMLGFADERIGRPFAKRVLIVVRDMSSSMFSHRHHYPGIERQLFESLRREYGDDTLLIQLDGSFRLEPVTWMGISTLREYQSLSPQAMDPGSEDYRLEGGSAISDWLRVSGAIALELKRRGFEDVQLVAMTDGWNRSGGLALGTSEDDWRYQSEGLARKTLQSLRQKGIPICFLGFCPSSGRRMVEDFARNVGLLPAEIFAQFHDGTAEGRREATEMSFTHATTCLTRVA